MNFVTSRPSDYRIVKEQWISHKPGSPDLIHTLPPGWPDLHLGLIVNLCCPCVYSPGSNLFSQGGDAVIPGLCSVRQVLQMGNNELLTSIKWNFSKRFWQTDIVGEFTLVLDFYSKQTAGISDYVPGEGFLFCLLIPHHSVLFHIGWISLHIMVIRSPICEPEKLAWTISISFLLGIVNTFSDTLIRFIQSENSHMYVCNWDWLSETCCQISQMGFVISWDELLNLADALVPNSLEVKDWKHTEGLVLIFCAVLAFVWLYHTCTHL